MKNTTGYKITALTSVIAVIVLSFYVYGVALISYTALAETSIPEYKPSEWTKREVTQYNVGDPNQTDSSPCIGASGDNLCTLLAQGVKVCAANFVPLGTELRIKGHGKCVVLDRMNSRYPNNVDIALTAEKKGEALKFGRQLIDVAIINK